MDLSVRIKISGENKCRKNPIAQKYAEDMKPTTALV